MVRIDKALLPADGPALPCASTGRLILQIHDELLFEVGAGHAAELRALVRDAMEGAYADRMRVPLKVQLRQGPSWGELEKVDA